ncbi:ubiquitin carboxyl-terminal hydrolase CYLD [Salvelinus sp. IW2-2015]|uniref:ubiquitin carboxyl-terminal hydrolase CYLD n=1 Tax=Salvelinus sp. IW2-2015 TaxID=2691554 RepID=UPI0038D45E89
MSGAQEYKRRQPPKMYLVVSNLKIQDQLEGTIRLLRGNLCQEQEGGRSRGDQLWVKVLDYGCMVKIDKQLLKEVPTDLTGLLEPVSDPESRLNLLINPKQLYRLAALPLGTPLYVQMGQPGELAEAELRYRGPLTRGSTAVLFGVQLKDSAVGRGNSNGSYKGHQLFTCPEASALFLPANQIRLRRWSRANDDYHNNALPPQPQPLIGNIIARTAESSPSLAPVLARNPSSPPPLQVGHRVCFPLEDTVHGGEVRFCGVLPGRTSTGVFVGILLDNAVGNWDGSYKGEKLCSISSSLYGCLLPISKVSPGTTRSRANPSPPEPQTVLNTTQPPAPVSSPASTPKIALKPPTLSAKLALKLHPPSPHLSRTHPFPNPSHIKPLTLPSPTPPTNHTLQPPAFAEWGSERVEEHTPPVQGDEARDMYQGWKRGIQGHLNSCYLDASLFSLFSCCSSVDWVLLWPSNPSDGPHCSQAQDLLRCEIVNPLRRFGYVCASKTMALRRLLEAESSDTGFTNQEKDPEEFLNKLFQLLRVEPLLKIRSVTQKQQPQECHLYQLFPPSVPLCPSSPVPLSPSLCPIPLSSPAVLMRVANVQTLLETSFLHAGLKFAEAPSCLPLLMPRFGKDFKMFDAILPSLTIDITDLLDDTLRQCSICQAVAEWECLECYEDLDITPGHLKQYCHTCNTQVHIHKKRQSHSPCQVGVAGGPWTGPLHGTRQRLALFAVTCIETSHYVSFVKHGPRPDDWLFFDSMADREGGENGFNIPQVRACPEVGRYLSLSAEELGRLDPASLRESARRLLCDSYMCLYHSPELSLYK